MLEGKIVTCSTEEPCIEGYNCKHGLCCPRKGIQNYRANTTKILKKIKNLLNIFVIYKKKFKKNFASIIMKSLWKSTMKAINGAVLYNVNTMPIALFHMFVSLPIV